MGRLHSRVTVERSACPAREPAPFCVFRAGRITECQRVDEIRMEKLATEGS